jgi:16S rRNA (guanine527-N7)-methyltransferase
MPVADLREILADAQRLGFVGGQDVEPHLHHAEAFVAVIDGLGPPTCGLDLGSGGGLPGLVLADQWPASRWWLLDAGHRRADFLTSAVTRLGWEDRVTVVCGRAEELARSPELRGHMDLVTSRAFGPPAVTAECGSGFLRPGGHLVVSEPPPSAEGGADGRWPAEGLSQLGLEVVDIAMTSPSAPHFRVLHQYSPCPDRYPRRVGVPAKRPLF